MAASFQRFMFAAGILVCLATASGSQSWAGELQIGQPPPEEIGGTLSSGDWVGAKDHRGKHLLVVYWSMKDPDYVLWDQELREIRQKYLDNRGFMILSICVDDDFDKWMEYLSKAKKFEANGQSFEIFRDRTWWHAHASDYAPHKALLDPDHKTVVHLLSREGNFQAIRIPVKDLKATVQSKLGEAQ